jgi:hypothetical protein
MVTSINDLPGKVILILLFHMSLLMDFLFDTKADYLDSSDACINIYWMNVLISRHDLVAKNSSVRVKSFKVLILSSIFCLSRQ